MALITNFSTLVAAIKDRANRTDMTDADAEGFIQQAENRLNRLLRMREMEEIATVTTDSLGVGSIPADFLEMRAVYDSESNLVEFVNPEWIITAKDASPKAYALMGGDLRLSPAAAETLTLLYYKAIPALTSSSTTNWLLTAHPDVYLYAGLLAFAVWRDEDEDIAKWDAALNRAVSEVMTAAEANRASGPTRMPRDFLYGRYLHHAYR